METPQVKSWEMMVKSIMDIVLKNVGEYNAKLAEKFNLNIDELNAMWEEVSGEKPKVKKPRAKKAKNESGDETGNSDSEKTCCKYVFSKGANAGQSCSVVPKGGAEYCSKHKAQSDKPAKDKKDKKEKTEKKKTFVIRKNKDLDMFWNPETKLVFKSKEEKVVIGSCQDGKLETLTNDDIETCQKYSLAYEVAKEEVEEEAEEEAEEEEAEEVDEEDE